MPSLRGELTREDHAETFNFRLESNFAEGCKAKHKKARRRCIKRAQRNRIKQSIQKDLQE